MNIAEHLLEIHKVARREISKMGNHCTSGDEFVALEEIVIQIAKARKVFERTKDVNEKV